MPYTVKQIAQILCDGRYLEMIEASEMANPQFGVIVVPGLFGMYKIQVLNLKYPPEGNIVRELTTYHAVTARLVLQELRKAPDPEAYCRSLETRYNCDHPGRGRIRLDLADTIEPCPKQNSSPKSSSTTVSGKASTYGPSFAASPQQRS